LYEVSKWQKTILVNTFTAKSVAFWSLPTKLGSVARTSPCSCVFRKS